MTTFDGLPAHVLLVHAVVVLIPLSAFLLVLIAVWPGARRRLSGFTAVLALLALICVPLTTAAGEWLQLHVPDSPLVQAHAELGGGMLPWAVALFVVALAVATRQFFASRKDKTPDEAWAYSMTDEDPDEQRRDSSNPGGPLLTVLIAVFAIAVSAGAIVQVYRVGDSGSRAAWTGKFSQSQSMVATPGTDYGD
jgi:hypothetical protein